MNNFEIGDNIEFSRNGETITGKIINLTDELIQIKSASKGKIYSLPVDNLQYQEKTVASQKVKVVSLTGFDALKKGQL